MLISTAGNTSRVGLKLSQDNEFKSRDNLWNIRSDPVDKYNPFIGALSAIINELSNNTNLNTLEYCKL